MSNQAVTSVSYSPVAANVINANRFVNLVAGTATVDESTAAGDCVGVGLEAFGGGGGTLVAVGTGVVGTVGCLAGCVTFVVQTKN